MYHSFGTHSSYAVCVFTRLLCFSRWQLLIIREMPGEMQKLHSVGGKSVTIGNFSNMHR